MPKKVDLAAQRQVIARAALTVITGSGLEGARLRDVARAADVTTGAVMHYFDGKDAVIEAALAEIVRRTLARMETKTKPLAPGDVAAFIGRVGRYLPIDDEAREEWRVWLVFWGRAMHDQRLREVHRAHYQNIVDRLIAPLQALRASPAPAAAARACADALVAAIDGVGVRATLEPVGWPAKRQKETLAALLSPLLTAFVGVTEKRRA